MPAYEVSLSIVTYNDEKHIGNLLDAIYKNVKRVKYRIFVTDNGSTDNTVEIVKNKGYGIILIQNEKNLGFGAGHNKAIGMIDSKYHVCINPDIFFDADVISDMADYLDDNGDIGVLTPKVLYPDGQVQVLPKKDPRIVYLLARRIGIKPLKKYREEYEMLDMGADKAFDIEFATGCFMFLRTEMLKKVGGFDERYFLYFEDADLTRSIRKFARAQYNPAFSVCHHWDRAGARKLKYFLIQIQSMLRYMRKWKREKR
ncbi:MAG: glycosyltransferase family 2 protein [Eubacteriales bacterium]|nr:glycosyltransferase family 2 protein [Eubacteriales bacterium]